MKLLTRNTDYALRVLLYMYSNPQETVSAKFLQKRLGIPYYFLRRLLQILHRYKILLGQRGRGGGFSLKKDIGNLTLARIIKIFQGEIILNECVFRKSPCPRRRSCLVRAKILQIEEYVRRKLNAITIAQLVSQRRK